MANIFFDNIQAFFQGHTVGTMFLLLFFTVVIILYSLFIFYFYRFLAKKNFLNLNLNQYNRYENPTAVKILATLFYILEYIVLLPVLTFFWFSVLAALLLVLAEGIKIQTILLISAALVASVRVTSYVSEDLARDLSKMLPFTLLAIALTKPGFFDINAFLSRASEIPSLFSNILVYLVFIILIEIVMRVSDLFNKIFGQQPQEEEKNSE